MIRFLLLALGVGSALGGVSIQMPYLNPAGVTYTGVAALPSQLQYSAATTSSVAYGNAAFLGRSLGHAVSYTAPEAQYAVPVQHYAAPVAHVAHAVPTIHHVPAIAQLPVTKYEAQPGVIQNLVDVAKPKLATRKIEIRRPAIQKQFYDVEERVVIKPAGSAVVELDQPVSKSQRGPTVVQPALHAVSTPVVGFRALHSHHHIVPANYPASFSIHPYPIQGPAAIPIQPSPAPQQEAETHEEIPQEPQQITEQQEEQQIPQQGFQQNPQQGFQQNPQQEFQQVPQQGFQQNPQQVPQQEFQQEPQQFDDSDSVAVDNPEIARARSQQPESIEAQQGQSSPREQQEQSQPTQSQDQLQSLLPQSRSQLFFPQQQLLERFQATNFDRSQAIARSQLQAQEQVVAQLQAQTQAQQAQLQRSEQLLQLQQQQLVRSRQAADSVARSQSVQQEQPQNQRESSSSSQENQQSEGLPSVGPEPQRASLRILEAGDLRSALINNIARSTSSPSEIPSFRISPQQSISNQERLISLLTARGGVVEVRNQGDSGDSHQVRARVLSVTPAPEGASPQEEKVNTRRIVVSRPIQTVEEVDVVEPFTKIERVAVHSPAVIKTARLGVAHVPTSVPVQGYAHTLHAAIPAY